MPLFIQQLEDALNGRRFTVFVLAGHVVLLNVPENTELPALEALTTPLKHQAKTLNQPQLADLRREPRRATASASGKAARNSMLGVSFNRS